jgi:hypothetical protein
MSGEAEYIREHYGQCAARRCQCRLTNWRGTACKDWQPTVARNYAELAKWQQELRTC